MTLKPALMCIVLLLPSAAFAKERMTQEQLIAMAVERKICKDREVVSAKYENESSNRVVVTCGDDAAGFVPLAGLGLGGAAAAAAGLAAVALAGGGGGGIPSTNGTD